MCPKQFREVMFATDGNVEYADLLLSVRDNKRRRSESPEDFLSKYRPPSPPDTGRKARSRTPPLDLAMPFGKRRMLE